MTEDEILDAIADGTIGALSIDTSIFYKYQFGLTTGYLKTLEQFKAKAFPFLMPDIVYKEIQKAMIELAKSSQRDVKNAFKEVKKNWTVSQAEFDQIANILYKEETPEVVVGNKLQSFIDATGLVIEKAEDHIAISKLFEMYFNSEAPFAENTTKKNEFPDASALLTLESWAQKNRKLVLVISKDEDWSEYCKTSVGLVCMNELTTALKLLQNQVGAYRFIERLTLGQYSEIVEQLLSELNSNDDVEFHVEADSQFSFDHEFDEVAYSAYIIENGVDAPIYLEPVEFTEDYITVKTTFSVKAEITSHFSFQKWDGIDKEYMPMGSTEVETVKDIYIDAVISFAFDVDSNLEIDSIEIISQSVNLYYGEIEPDWMNIREEHEY
jgi:predicted nucleic acid-binding protein